MYSMVVMMAMSTSPEAATFGWRHGCNGCYGASCHGVVTTSCYGGCVGTTCYGGCVGTTCHGCGGCSGFMGNGFLGLGIVNWRGCNGCVGSCQGCIGSCQGCVGSCHGCIGAPSGCVGSCHGCIGAPSGCVGSCHGCIGAPSGCIGAPSGCIGAPSGCIGAPSGCIGVPSHGCIGGVVTQPPVIVVTPVEKKVMPKPEDKPKEKDKPKPTETELPATIVLNVPDQAKVTIDGVATSSTTTVRTFVTPALNTNAAYTYTFNVEVVRDGKVYSESKEVVVQGGKTVTLDVHPGSGSTVVAR